MTTPTTLSAPSVRPAAAVVRGLHPAAIRHRSGPVRLVARPMSCAGSAPPDLHGSRLTGRGRVAVAVVWLMLAGLAAVPLLRLGDRQVENPVMTTTVVVEPGDTLWALAGEVDSAADPRTVIRAIIELNGLGSAADIHPGDRLVVPVSR